MTIAIILVISHVVVYFTTQHFVIDRHNRMVMFLAANQVKLFYVGESKKHSRQPEANIAGIIQSEGHRVGDDNVPTGLKNAKYHQGLSQQGERYLGKGTHVKVEVTDGTYLWINESQTPQMWIRVPVGDYDGGNSVELFIFTGMLLFLSLAGAWVLMFQFHRPLKRLAFAAREVGRGEFPGKLKETGPVEFVSVTTAFNQMAADIHQLEEERTLLLAGISHDLRTPITRIRLALEFLSADNEDLKMDIVDDTNDMEAIIDQFIGYVRHGSEERKKKVDFGELVQNVVDSASKQHEGLILKTTDLPLIDVKPMAVKRLLSNLIENAFRYGKAPVIVTTSLSAEKVFVSVRDYGKGIKDLDKKRLFQPFATGDSARGGKGSGLGLAIAAKIVELHSGSINIDNHPDGGLEVVFTIPCYPIRQFLTLDKAIKPRIIS